MENKYFSNIRKDLIGLINKKEIVNALEIGGGDFDTLKYIVDKFKCKGTGLDIRVPENVNSIKFYQCDLDNIDKNKLEFIQKLAHIIRVYCML